MVFLHSRYLFLILLFQCSSAWAQEASSRVATPLFRIEVRDAENDWPVPLVELRTIHEVRFVSDNDGVIAFDLAECFERETYLYVESHGYEVAADGFGFRGVRITPHDGKATVVRVHRTSIAKRLGRLTGKGLLAHSQRLGGHRQWQESPVMGCDSVQMAIFQGKPFWAWGDTNFAHYPLGNFNMTGARSLAAPVSEIVPPIFPRYDYFMEASDEPSNRYRTRGVAPLPGKGPTWLSNFASVPDDQGKEHLVAVYRKIQPPMETYETGLCRWDEKSQKFVGTKVVWKKSNSDKEPPSSGAIARVLRATGHSFRWTDGQGKEWLMHGNPFPVCRCPANLEGWSDLDRWQSLDAPTTLAASDSEKRPIQPHSGSMAWNAYRHCYVALFMEHFGKPSAFGEIWYAEADNPLGPWRPAVKVLSHHDYTFYNPRLWGEFAMADSPVLLFEGTYTRQFSRAPMATPRYDYNQMLYRLDLNDPALRPAQQPPTVP